MQLLLVAVAKYKKHQSYAPVAQLDRVGGFEPLGREFESLRVRQTTKGPLYAGLFCLWYPVSENSAVRQNAPRFGRLLRRPSGVSNPPMRITNHRKRSFQDAC